MTTDIELEKVSPQELKEIVKYAIKCKTPLFIEGKSGIGKSRIISDVCEQMDINMIDMRAILYDIGDLVMKIPDKDHHKMVEVVTEQLPTEGKGIIFLDEFKQAPTEVRRMFYQLILDRKLGASYELPEDWSIISASNLDEEIEQEDLEGPLFDRFVMRVRLETGHKLWRKWAMENGISMTVISFLENFQDKFYITNNDGVPLMTPRRWEQVSVAEKNKATKVVFRSIIPVGLSDMFLGFKKRIDLFKDVKEYLNGKKEAPEDLDGQYALATAIINNIKNDDDLKSLLSAKIKGLNTEVEVFMRLTGITNYMYSKKKKNPMAFIQTLDKDIKEQLIETYTKYGWLVNDDNIGE